MMESRLHDKEGNLLCSNGRGRKREVLVYHGEGMLSLTDWYPILLTFNSVFSPLHNSV